MVAPRPVRILSGPDLNIPPFLGECYKGWFELAPIGLKCRHTSQESSEGSQQLDAARGDACMPKNNLSPSKQNYRLMYCPEMNTSDEGGDQIAQEQLNLSKQYGYVHAGDDAVLFCSLFLKSCEMRGVSEQYQGQEG